MNIAVVIPCYNVSKQIALVVAAVRHKCNWVICVNDCSKDDTAAVLQTLQATTANLVVWNRVENGGVGAAMLDGYTKAVELQADIIVKMDGDGQMDADLMEMLIKPLRDGKADFVKGNRFNDFKALQKMPVVRRVGNLGMSFLIKAASGYWDVFDPANGYFAIRTSFAARLEQQRIAKRYFFESSQIIELYYLGTRVKDVAMPAIYGDETSHLSVKKVLFEFPPKIIKAFFRRIFLRYYIFDINIASFYFLFGNLLFWWGIVFGIIKWLQYRHLGIPAPTGTVILPTLTIVLGFQMLLAAINYDIENGKIRQ